MLLCCFFPSPRFAPLRTNPLRLRQTANPPNLMPSFESFLSIRGLRRTSHMYVCAVCIRCGRTVIRPQPAFLELYERHADPGKRPGPGRQAKLKSASQLQVGCRGWETDTWVSASQVRDSWRCLAFTSSEWVCGLAILLWVIHRASDEEFIQ
jgi:hypothetical protein